MSELWQQTAIELAATFRDGDATAVEIVTAHLARIDDVNPSVNAVVRRIDDRALAHAAAADEARADGAELGPLAGVPFTIKDNIDVAGDVTTHSVPAFADFVPTLDAPVVERMKEAGAIPLARTNLPDMGLRLDSDSSVHGWTANPWDPSRTAGGSSGGEAVALATGMSPVGLGNDLGGSLRNPATCCGIASIKPTFGLVPHALQGPLADESLVEQIIAVEGPMARTVADVRQALTVLAGSHARDPWSVPALLDFNPQPLRVAVLSEPPGGDTDPRIAALVARSAEWLASAGHHVEAVVPEPYQATSDCWTSVVVGGVAQGLDEVAAVVSEDAIAFLADAISGAGELASPGQHERAWIDRHLLIQAWNEFYRSFDVLVTPTWTHLPFERGFDVVPSGGWATVIGARPVMAANVLGFPAAAVPAGMIDGLPVGLLVNGPAWSDLTCLSVAADIEAGSEAAATPIDPKERNDEAWTDQN